MPLSFVRRLVSGQKKRFQDGGFDLDLAYITPRVIAMGLPAHKGSKEVLYRNPMQEISRFLHTYHSRHAKVYNLCSEHSYSAAHLQHPVALQQYPYDDHQTPPLAMVQQFCLDAAAWLAADPANVVVVHCKAGKGRTGIMICCLLLYLHKNAPDLANLPLPGDSAATTRMQQLASHSAAAAAAAAGVDLTGQQQQQQQQPAKAFNSRLWHPWQVVPPLELRQLERPVQDVLDAYAERRTHDGNGVTIKSQRRYVGYFWAVLCSGPGPVGALPRPMSVQLRQVTVSGLPPGTADSCVMVVEARPSGSLAPRASRVCARSAPGALSGSLTGLCMVPCAHVPLVQEDSCCSISSSPHGDTLTFRMPAASMGLSPLPLHSSSTATRTASAAAESQVAEAAPHCGPAGGADSSAAGRQRGCCVCCGAPAASSCACSTHPDALPGAAPAGQQPAAALATAGARADSSSSSSCAGGLADDSCWDASEQAGCCVVEGDVRLVVLKGTTRLFYTWFNTAFLPTAGCYTLTRSQLDKPSKTLPLEVTLTVRYVDMQPTATEAAESGQQQHQQGADGQQEHKQVQSKPWLHSFEEPPLETSRRGGKGSAQQAPGGAKQQQIAGNSMLARAGVGTVQAAAAGSSGSADSTEVKAQPAAVPGTQQQQQRVSEGCAQPVPVSSSAPASPQDRRLQGSGSWRHHLPAISSISTSALLWGVPASAPGAGQQRTPSTGPNKPDSWPGSWCGSAGRSWDWDTLAAAEDGAEQSAGSGDAAPAAAAAGSGGPAVRDAPQPGARGGSSSHRNAGSAGAAALPSQQQPWRRALLPGRERASSSGGGSKGTRISQDLHSTAASGSSRVVPALLPSQASIELPVIVKRPSGVDSLVDALLDPEHSASSQSALSAAAAAAAAASGQVLASEASSSAVAVTGAKPPAQLRKGYSWHGASNGSWFSAAVAAGSRGGSRRSSNSSSCSHSEARTLQQQLERPYADDPAAAALEASVLDLDPLLLSERSGEVPGSVLSSFDPLQGLLEALNWGTDMQRYRQRHQQTSTSTSTRSTSSEPSSPRRGARVLPTVVSSPQLQPTRSAPISPVKPEKQVCPGAQDVQAGRGHTATPPAEQSSRGLRGRSGLDAAGPGHSARPSGRGAGSRSGGSGSAGSSSSRRRPRAVRPDVCRLLDLEDWAEDEAEGLEGGDTPDAGVPAAAARGGRAAATGSVARSQSPQGKGGVCAAGPGAPSGATQGGGRRAVGLRRRSSEDAAADADVPVPPPTPVKDPKGAATRVSARRSPAVGWRGGSSSSRAAAVGDESRLGLLAAEGRAAPSCAAEAPPAVQQQWQQLEKAWQKSWWV